MIGCIPPESSSPAITILDNEEQDSASRAASINANSVDPMTFNNKSRVSAFV